MAVDAKHCPKCGVELPGMAPEGFCPHCVNIEALATQRPGSTDVDATSDWTHEPTDIFQTADRPQASESLPHGTSVQYFGDYELQKELGRGGMGVVYKAKQVSLNRPVALKMIKAGVLADEDELRRFLNEAEAVALLDHAGIVPVYEVGEHDGQRYFSMKLVEGGNLTTQLAAMKANPRAAATLLAETAEAVHHAHMRGILHRDLKPANILIDAEGHPHVTDFGLAKRVESDIEITQSGAILGTPAYMSPEQATARRGSITTATDVYGLGAVLYAVLTGKAPFGGGSVVETLDAVRNRPPEYPRKFNPNTPRDLETICLKCLEKDPRRRYASAHELAADLRNWLDSRPITARRVGTTERAWLWCKRRPALAAMSAATILAVFGGTSGMVAVQAKANSDLLASNRLLDKANIELTSSNGKLDQTNRELISSNIALDLQRARAERHEKEAIDAVKKFRDAIVDNPELRNNAALGSLRKTLLKEPLAFFRSLRSGLQEDGDTRPQSLVRLANAMHEYAHLSQEIGDARDALKSHEESLAVWKKLAADEPTVPDRQYNLSLIQFCRGTLMNATGRAAESRAEYEAARAIQSKLVESHPDDANYQEALALTHGSIGNLLKAAGRRDEALGSLESARTIFQALADAHLAVARYRGDLAKVQNSVATLLRNPSDPEPALKVYEAARANFQALVEAGGDYRWDLAITLTAVGSLLREAGRLDEALKRYEAARPIHKALVEANPSATLYQESMGASHYNLGNLLRDMGRLDASLKAYEDAFPILERLATEHPESPERASSLGALLSNMGLADRNAGKFDRALDRFKQATVWQKKALAIDPAHPRYRSYMTNHLKGQVIAARSLGREADAVAAERALAQFEASDPRLAALDARLAAVTKGEKPNSNAERLELAQRAYDRSLHLAAVRLWSEAMESEPKLANDRRAQLRYNSSCAAALAASGQCTDEPRPDDAAKARLRHQALNWLNTELTIWSKFVESGPPQAKAFIAQTLKHWEEDTDLATVREEKELAKLTEAERKDWKTLWADVDALLAKATAGK
jgi:serine/threonine protein kinase